MASVPKITQLPILTSWVTNTVHTSTDQRYYHRLLEEDVNFRAAIIAELKSLVHLAHEDSRKRYRDAFDLPHSLDPLEENATPGIDTSIIDDFPRYLDFKTLKGYFGEIFSAVIAENLNSLNEDWTVPVFPFRHHQMAYHALEKIRQEGGTAPIIVGRFGDDMLAFQRDSGGKITHALVCEAKCTAEHNIRLISDAHEKASEARDIPTDCMFLAETLKVYEDTDPVAASWRQSIIQLSLGGNDSYERCDFVSYICGKPPVSTSTVIIPQGTPHSSYTAGRRLEAVEVHLYDVDGLITEAYQAIIPPAMCALSASELSTCWANVVSHLPSKRRAMCQQHCCLLAFDGKVAVIGVDSLILFREILRQKRNIKRAFLASGLLLGEEADKSVGIKLRVYP